MKFADFICRDAVNAELEAKDKEGVIREMTEALLDAGQIAEPDYESVLQAIRKRIAEQGGQTSVFVEQHVFRRRHRSFESRGGGSEI